MLVIALALGAMHKAVELGLILGLELRVKVSIFQRITSTVPAKAVQDGCRINIICHFLKHGTPVILFAEYSNFRYFSPFEFV